MLPEKHIIRKLSQSIVLTCVCFAQFVIGADLDVTVRDLTGAAADHAVVSLLPLFDFEGSSRLPLQTSMKQQEAMFRPFVLAVKTNTSVSFPNMDEFRHQVYSFSAAKQFELRLYGKDESKEIVFEKPGVVALGCNIHDNLLAYIYVTDAPYFLQTDGLGTVSFPDLVPGKYEMTVWHPDQKKRRESYKQEVLVAADNERINVALKMRSVRRRQQEADTDTDGYSEW